MAAHEQSDSEFIKHVPCEECGSSDANSLYTDGHTYCFSCGAYGAADGDTSTVTSFKPKPSIDGLKIGQAQALPARSITEESCQKYGYKMGTYNGQTCQVAIYRRDGQEVAYKLRFRDKSFKFLGDPKNSGLFGQHLYKPGGKTLCITEGEIDALTVSQVVTKHKWPVVSLPNGAQAAVKAIKSELEWVSSFEKVILMFDMDEPGQKAAKEVAALLSPRQAHIAHLPLKDPNECLLKGKSAALVDSYYQARPYTPDGILNGADLWERISKPDNRPSIEWPFTGLQGKTSGLRRGELVTVTAGSGVGKSQFCREIAYDILKKGDTVGYIALEENVRRTALGLVGLEADKPLHIDPTSISDEEMKKAFDATLGTGRVYLYDHFGSLEADNLLDKVRYLAKGLGVNWVILDHLSIVVSGIDDGDERKTIDVLMTKLRSLVEETGIGLILVSHLKRPEGKTGWEEGLQTSLNALRGSASIAQLSDTVIGLERNQQSLEEANEVTVRVLKNRHTGDTGVADTLHYDKDTGRLHESISMFM